MPEIKKKLLLIEDNVDIAMLVKFDLEFAGYEVVVAYTGEDGMKKAEAEHPDLVILDISLPDKNGYEVCVRMKTEKFPLMPIVMLTSMVRSTDEKLGYACKADAYIRKPECADRLLPEVARLLKNSVSA